MNRIADFGQQTWLDIQLRDCALITVPDRAHPEQFAIAHHIHSSLPDSVGLDGRVTVWQDNI